MFLKIAHWIFACSLFWAASSANADIVQVEREIRLPDGQPAKGAKVLIRSWNEKDGSLKQEKRAIADEKGIVRTQIEVNDNLESFDPSPVAAYMMVDVPGYALAFENFASWWRLREVNPLVLRRNYEITGKVLAVNGEPAGNADVMIGEFISEWNKWPINNFGDNIITPETTVKTNADGTFALRSIEILDIGDSVPRPLILVRAKKNGEVFTAQSELVARRVLSPDGAKDEVAKPGTNVIRVSSSATVQGRILSELNGRPVGGVKIELRADPADEVGRLVGPISTAADGSFKFVGVTISRRLFIVASHPDYGNGWRQVDFGNTDAAIDTARTQGKVELRLRPLIDVKGTIIDIVTNKTPTAPIKITSFYDEGYNDGRFRIDANVVTGRMNSDGTYAMRMPLGLNQLRVRGPGHREAVYNHTIDLEIKQGNPENQRQKLSVRREKGFLTHFITSSANGKTDFDIDKEYDLWVRGADGKEVGTNWGEWWYWHLYEPSDTAEIRVTRSVNGIVHEVVPWTKLNPNSPTPADAQNWPRQIHLPLKQTITLNGKVVDLETGKPYSGVTVTLELTYSTNGKRVKRTTTNDEGSFTFADVLLPKSLMVSASISKEPEIGITSRTSNLAFPRLNSSHEILAAVRTDGDEGKQEINDIVIDLKALDP